VTPSATRTRPLSRRLLSRRGAVAVAGALVLIALAVFVPTVFESEPYSLQRFHSRPDLRPPQIEIAHGHAIGRGYVFVAPKNGPGPAGPMILDRRGRVVWFKHLPKGIQAFDFKPQRYRGKPVLTWWEGHSAKGNGAGEDVITDTSYREIARIPMHRGYRADLHEFALTRRGTALVLAYHPVPYDLRRVGGPRHGKAVEGVIQEIDVRTGRVVFEWHSLAHVRLTESYKKFPDDKGNGYDYFHINSVREGRNGNLLISARHTNAVYEIDRRTGAVLWRLGGKRSSFRMGPGTRFVAQHDARRGPGGTVSVFDNQAPPDSGRESRVVLIRIDPRTRRARLVHQYKHPEEVHSDSQGSAQFLPNGDVFVGWGGKSPYFTEYTRGGRILFDAKFRGHNTNSYRAFLLPWRGTPRRRPAVDVQRDGRRAVVYASWNGATELAAWEVLGGRRPRLLHRVAVRRRTGFETRLGLRRPPRFLVVRALDRTGKPLRRSRLVRVPLR
jgi:Arylsulfotransferase (ASST)